jgi:hypothetical protein
MPNKTFKFPLKEYSNIAIGWRDVNRTTHINNIFLRHHCSSSNNYTLKNVTNEIAIDIWVTFMNSNHASRNMILNISNWRNAIWHYFFRTFLEATI